MMVNKVTHMRRIFISICLVPVLMGYGHLHAENIRLAETVTIITAKDIEDRQPIALSDLLREVYGLDVIRTGGFGQETSVFIRGAESQHTLVLIDGIKVNSPTTGGFDFADITVDNIERIEIIRGSLSALYGSDAIGGVIQIFSKKAKMSSGTASFEAGSYSTAKETLSTEVKQDSHDITLSVSRIDTQGFSATKSGSERDDFHNTSVSSNFGIARGATTSLDFSAHLTESKTGLDDVNKVDDPNYQQQRRLLLLGMSATSSVTNNWMHTLSLSISDDKLIHLDEVTPLNRDQFDSGIQTINWQNQIRDEGNLITLGYEWQRQKGEKEGVFSKIITNNALFLEDQRGVGTPVQYLIGIRWDDGSLYKSILTYRFGMSYIQSEGVRWHAQYGTGFHGATLNDLFVPDDGSYAGNSDLKPEKSSGWEVGVEQTLSDSMSLSVNYYKNDFTDLIQWIPDSTGKSQPHNFGKANSKGFETDVTWHLSQIIRIDGNYTYDDTEDRVTHTYLLRRPLNKYMVIVHLNPAGRGRLDVNLLHVGRRVDAGNMGLSAYSKMDLIGSYKISKSMELFGRIENLFDKEYEEAKGYNTAGFSTYGGLKMTF